MKSLLPFAVTICCSFDFPEKDPTTAWVTALDGLSVSEYMNMLDVVAILANRYGLPAASRC